ncbi:hypothetical protein SprV_0301069600 [Sparganum proliferum]
MERTGIINMYAILRQLQLHWGDHLVQMDDERLPKQLFYEEVAISLHRQGSQIRRYKDALKTSLRRLQINPTDWKDIARTRTALTVVSPSNSISRPTQSTNVDHPPEPPLPSSSSSSTSSSSTFRTSTVPTSAAVASTMPIKHYTQS